MKISEPDPETVSYPEIQSDPEIDQDPETERKEIIDKRETKSDQSNGKIGWNLFCYTV